MQRILPKIMPVIPQKTECRNGRHEGRLTWHLAGRRDGPLNGCYV